MKTAKFTENFRKIGFSQNETQVYLALVKLGSSKAGKIAKYASMDRSSVYNALKSLMQKGMVSYVIVGKTRWFQCSNPKNIMTYLSNKLDLAKEFVPELDKVRRQSKLKEDVRLFKGNNGIKTVFEDILRNADENLIFGSEGQFSKKMPFFEKQFTKRMENKGIKVKSIVRSNRKVPKKDRVANRKSIPSTTESPVVTNIYKNKIAIIIWSEIPEAILIENEKAANAYRDYFNFMWKHAD
ncbi:MAG: helix-turn-helix domain-containing protein [archaeon]